MDPTALSLDQSLDPRSVMAARLVGTILTAAVSLPALGGVVIAALAAPWSVGLKLGLLAAWAMFTVVAAVASSVWPDAR